MKRITFDRLLKSGEKFKSILDDLNIKPNNENRIFKSLQKVKELNDELIKTGEINDYETRLFQGREIEALMDASEIDKIVPSLKKQSNKKILKKCLTNILSGSEYRSDETVSNNKARNTMFELLLFSDFVSAGLPAELGDQNPDIIVRLPNAKYLIECKRIFNNSNQSIKSNLIKASKQLSKQLGQPNIYGVIGLSLDRYYTAGKKLLDSTSGEKAIQFLFKEQELFMEKNRHLWLNPSIIRSDRIIGIILYIGVPTMTKLENIPSYATNIVITDTFTNYKKPELFKQLAQDFGALKNNIIT